MSGKLSVPARRGGLADSPAESPMAAIGGELDTATALQPAAGPRLDELTDGELLARCHRHAPGSRERAAACEVLVRRYTPLVRSCVRPYRNSPEPVEDLMQVGYLGLLKAIGNYDPEFENGLRAFAVPCITGEIKRHFRDKRWQVRVTRPLQELLLEVRGATEDLTHELGRQPYESELAGRLGVTPEELHEARQAGNAFSALSLNVPVGQEEDSAELGDLLGAEDAAVERAEDMESVARHWEELPRREQQILILRFYGNHTQEEVAARLGLSQMHVSRLQARALARLRERMLGLGDSPAQPGGTALPCQRSRAGSRFASARPSSLSQLRSTSLKIARTGLASRATQHADGFRQGQVRGAA